MENSDAIIIVKCYFVLTAKIPVTDAEVLVRSSFLSLFVLVLLLYLSWIICTRGCRALIRIYLFIYTYVIACAQFSSTLFSSNPIRLGLDRNELEKK